VPITNISVIAETEDTYFWNLRQSVADLKQTYAAAAYIKVDGECIYLKYAKYSAKTLAADYINTRGYAKTAVGGSLANLAAI
jgi:hypothetical protein